MSEEALNMSCSVLDLANNFSVVLFGIGKESRCDVTYSIAAISIT